MHDNVAGELKRVYDFVYFDAFIQQTTFQLIPSKINPQKLISKNFFVFYKPNYVKL